MSKRLSLSLSSNPTTGISSSPKPSIFSSLLANKTNANLKTTQNNNVPVNRHPTTPKKVFNLLDAENDEIDLVNHTANDYEFSVSSSKTAKVQLKKNIGDKTVPASGSTAPNKPQKPKETSNTRVKSTEALTQNSSLSSSPAKSQPRPILSTPPGGSSPIKMRKLESLSSDSFDEFDDTVKAKILESSDSDDDFDVPINTSRVSNSKVPDSVESIDSSPLHSPKQNRSPLKSQASTSSASSSQQDTRPKQAASLPASKDKKPTTPKKVVVTEEVPLKAKPVEAENAKLQPETKIKEKLKHEVQQKEETIISSSAPVATNRRLLQVAFDSGVDTAPEPSPEPKSKISNEEKPRPLSLLGNKNSAITLNSDDDFVQSMTKSSSKFSLKTSAKAADTKKDVVKPQEVKKDAFTAKTEPKKLAAKKEEPKKIQPPKSQPVSLKAAPVKVGSKDVPLNIGSDSSFEIESPTKARVAKETVEQSIEARGTSSQVPKLSIADLSRARSERIKQRESSAGSKLPKAEKGSTPKQATVPTIRSKQREFPVATEEDKEKFIEWSTEQVKGALAKGSKSSGEDNFTEEQVKEWSKAKITAWKMRHTNPNTYYYRFTDVGVLQHNGKFTVEEHTRWVRRYIEFKLSDWTIGNYWGVFSKALPHRVGYQCASYFRSLLKLGVIIDNSVKVPKGENQDEDVHIEEPTKSFTVLLPEAELGLNGAWKSKETKDEESKVNEWICQYHNLDLSSHNEKIESVEVSPSSGNTKKRKAEDELTPENATNRSPVEQGNKKRKIISPVANTPTLDNFFAVSKKTTPKQPTKSKKSKQADTAILRAATAASKTRSPVVSPSSLRQQNLSKFFSGVRDVESSLLQRLVESGKIPPPAMVRLPKPPLGLEWPRLITPYMGEGDMSSTKVTGYNYASSQLPKIAWDEVESTGPFFALLLDPPLRPKESDGRVYGKGYVTIDDVQTWIKVSSALIPKGFLFVWIEKEFISDIIKLAKKWKFLYVENLMWMKKHVNNKMMEEQGDYFNKSKMSLILFRKGHGDMELRHQRNPDVVEYPSLDTKDDVEGMRPEKPTEYVYNMIETLLPEANFNATTGKGCMLEIWAPKNASRKGWTHIYIEPSSAADLRESMDSLNNSMQVVEDSDDDILMQSAQNESELFGEEKSSDSLWGDSASDVDLEALLDKPSNEKSSARSKNNNNSDDDDVAIVSHVNRPEIVIEDEDDADVTEVKMHDVKSAVSVDDDSDAEEEQKSDRETNNNTNNTDNNNRHSTNNDEGNDEERLVLDESGSAHDEDDLEDFWNALTND